MGIDQRINEIKNDPSLSAQQKRDRATALADNPLRQAIQGNGDINTVSASSKEIRDKVAAAGLGPKLVLDVLREEQAAKKK